MRIMISSLWADKRTSRSRISNHKIDFGHDYHVFQLPNNYFPGISKSRPSALPKAAVLKPAPKRCGGNKPNARPAAVPKYAPDDDPWFDDIKEMKAQFDDMASSSDEGWPFSAN